MDVIFISYAQLSGGRFFWARGVIVEARISGQVHPCCRPDVSDTACRAGKAGPGADESSRDMSVRIGGVTCWMS